MFSVINGDEMFATMNILEVKKTGGDWVFWFSRFYFGAYIAVFTIVVLNLLVAIFMSAYESVRVSILSKYTTDKLRMKRS